MGFWSKLKSIFTGKRTVTLTQEVKRGENFFTDEDIGKRSGEPYTEDEIQEILREDVDDVFLAMKYGRTPSAIQTKRHKLRSE